MIPSVKCEHCQSLNTAKESGYAKVHQLSPITREPIGDEKLVHFYRCLSCGQQLNREDID